MTNDRVRCLVVVLVLGVLAACGGDGDKGFALDGSPRVPDDEGVVTAVDLDAITLDGDRRYEIADDLVSFSSIDLDVVPLLFTEHQYVQVGLDGSTVEWIGAIARPLTSEPPSVAFTGTVTGVDDGALVFRNGTVLDLGAHVDAANLDGKDVQVSLDPSAHAVTDVEAVS